MNGVMYFEIQATDPAREMSFYSKVFGWRFEKQDGLPVDYWRIEGAGLEGGLLARPVPVPDGPSGTNAFTCTIEVADFDVTAEVILAEQGIVAMAKFAVPGRCWQGYFLDPGGNVFGISQLDESAG